MSKTIGGPVLITGATGCVGSALVDQCLEAGYRVNVLVRSSSDIKRLQKPNVRIFHGDLLDREVLNQATFGIEVVFHLAASVDRSTTVRDGSDAISRVNVEGTRKLLEACTANNVSRFVFFSTVAVMARQAGYIDENTPCLPTTPYAQSKYEAEKLVLEHQRDHGLFVSILRLPLVYGPRDRGNVRRLIEAVDRKRYFIIGSGKNVKTLIYSENAAAAALHIAGCERANGQVYIASDGVAVNLTELSQAIAEELGVKLNSTRIPKPLALGLGIFCDWIKAVGGPSLPLSRDRVDKLTSHVQCSSEKMTRELDFQPPFSFQEGLTRTIEWHKRVKEEPAPLNAAALRYHA